MWNKTLKQSQNNFKIILFHITERRPQITGSTVEVMFVFTVKYT